jgi:asparagine synthase (glutamine-hydrolysing)
MVPTYIICREIRRHATVALGGDGGDELFAGYLHYSWLESQRRIRRLLPGSVRAPLAAFAGRCLPLGFQGRNQLLGVSDGISNCIAHIHMYFDRVSRDSLLRPDVLRVARESAHPEAARSDYADSRMETPLYAASSSDFSYYLPDDVLTKVDRASMLSSLEVRAPMLDARLIEFAFASVPDRLRATGKDRKILLKELAKRLLPASFDVQRKQGFSVPPSWFSQGWGAFMDEVLASASPKLFNPGAIRALRQGQRRGRRNTERLFALVLFELWRDAYQIALPV